MDLDSSAIKMPENGTKNNIKKLNAYEIIELDESDNSDIEILSVSPNIASRKRKKYFKNVNSKRQATIVHTNSVNEVLKNDQGSYIKEEVMLSETSDCSDNDECSDRINSRIHSKVNPNANTNYKSFTQKRRNLQNRKSESLSSITLNCPKCNKTEKVFTVTIKSNCKECKTSMTYICNECNNKYNSLSALFRHKKIQCKAISCKNDRCLTPKKLFIFKCVKCSQSQPIVKLNDNPLKCQKCNLRMTIECRVCSKTYSLNSGLWLHAKLQCQTESKEYYCNDCSFKCSGEAYLLRHFCNEHSDLYPMSVDCDKCGKNFADAIRLNHHKVVCGRPKYKCKFCLYKPKHLKNLEKHVIEKHPDQVENDKVENIEMVADEMPMKEKIIRPDKPKKIKKQQELVFDITDEKYLETIRRAYCSNCNTDYSIMVGYRKCKQCSNPFQYKCISCSKIFKTHVSLYRHTRRCHGERCYKCNKCGKLLAFSSDVKGHEKFCGLEPQNKCKFCSFVTKYKHNLDSHVNRMHNDNRKQYACKFCKIKYVTMRAMKNHLSKHHQDMNESVSSNGFTEEQINN